MKSRRRAIGPVSRRKALATAIEGLEGRRVFNNTYTPIAAAPFEQNWSPTTQITTNNDWSGVTSIIGYRGEALAATGTNVRDPSTILGDLSNTASNSIYVLANQTNAATNTGGVTEFELTNPTIGLVGAGSATAPNIVIHINATGVPDVRVQYTLRDLESGADNATQPVALQYRIGDTGNFTNVSAAFIADATAGPNVAGPDIPVDVTLVGIGNVPNLQLRIITADQSGNDENVGIDDIKISAATVNNNGTLAFSSSTYSPGEGFGTYQIPINRLGSTTGAITVDYAITPGTASNPADFTGPLTGTVSFANGQSLAFVNIPIVDDTLVEGTETLSITLSNPTGGAALGTPASTTVSIIDNEAPGSFALDAASKTVSEADGTVSFTVNRTGGSDGTTTISYATANGTATAGSDYTATSGTLTFATGETSKLIVIPITDDSTQESSENFTLTISNAVGGGTIGSPASATVTITDNDANGTLGFSAANYPVGENAGVVTITVNRTGGANGAVSVDYSTAIGTADGTDFAPATGTLNFADGETTNTFTVTILNDSTIENVEQFTVSLSNPTGGATLGSSSATVTITDDDLNVPTGLYINEAFIDPPGTNPPKQFIEIRGTPGASLDNVHLFQVEGDFDQGAGQLDMAIDLSGYHLGTNGLAIITAATNGWTPQDAATTVINTSKLDQTTTGFEFASYSFVLVFRNPAGDPIPALGTDFDSDNAKDANGLGTLDALPVNLTILDGFGTTDSSNAGDVRYVTSLPALTAGGSADAVVRINNALNDPNAFYYGVLSGANNTSLTFTTTTNQRSANFPAGVGVVTPGALNAGAVTDTTAPTVANVAFTPATGQKIVVTFSEDVSASVAATDFTLTRTSPSALSVSLVVDSISADGKTVTLSFASTGGIKPTILQDGTYTFTVRGGQVADAAGNTLASDANSTVKFLNADFNSDNAVNFNDLVTLAQNYNKTSGVGFATGDADYDGDVDFSDLVTLAQRYGSVNALSALVTAMQPAAPTTTKAKKDDGALIDSGASVTLAATPVPAGTLGTKKAIR